MEKLFPNGNHGSEIMNGIILYKSKYGATKRYAKWLQEKTGFEMMDVSKANIKDMMDKDVIVYGGGIYASGIACLDFLKKNYEVIKEKKIIVFCDGASPFEEKAFEEIHAYNMKGELYNLPFFYCRGGWDMQAMSFMDRNLCKMLKKAVGKKDPSSYEVWEQALMSVGEEACDWTDPKYLEPILKEIYGEEYAI